MTVVWIGLMLLGFGLLIAGLVSASKTNDRRYRKLRDREHAKAKD